VPLQVNTANTVQLVVDAFTEMAPKYERTVDHELRQFWGMSYHDFINRLLDWLAIEEAAFILDVATGQAAIPLALAKCSHWTGRVVGVDITDEMLRGAKERIAESGAHERITLICGSGIELPFTANSFDTAICALATHHMNLPALLGEMHRVVRPGGQLLVADVVAAPFWQSLIGRSMFRALAWWYGRRQGKVRMAAEMDALPNMRSPEEWRHELTRSGFVNPKIIGIPARHRWYPPGILIHSRADDAGRSI
jgi:ubiquinone/menaquinone biosynthesis C-methylase UbiE